MSRNRHMQYRRSIYRKRKIKAIVISTIIAFLVVFALFMIIGTALHAKTQPTPPEENEATDSEKEASVITPAKVVGAYALPLLKDGSSFNSRLDAIQPNANAVCLSLNGANGDLFFRSELASELSQLTTSKDAASLSNAVSSIDRNGFYISGLLYVTAFEQQNSLLRDVELATWGAVACEALQEGVGDILMIASSMSIDDVERMCDLADNIHETVEKSVVGLVIPSSVTESANSTSLIKQLSLHFNYLTLDVSVPEKDEDPLEYVQNKVSHSQLELMYYKMRVLLPYLENSEEQQKYIDILTRYNINNWMILP